MTNRDRRQREEGKRRKKGTSCTGKCVKTVSGVLNQRGVCVWGCELHIHTPCQRQGGATTLAAAAVPTLRSVKSMNQMVGFRMEESPQHTSVHGATHDVWRKAWAREGVASKCMWEWFVWMLSSERAGEWPLCWANSERVNIFVFRAVLDCSLTLWGWQEEGEITGKETAS